MTKLQHLLDSLYTSLPGLNPQYVKAFVDMGSIRFMGSQSASLVEYKKSYSAEITLLQFADDPDKVFTFFVWWCARFAPELVGADNKGFGFEAEILDKERCNLHITIPIEENVKCVSGEISRCVSPLIYPDFTAGEFVPIFNQLPIN